MGLKTFKATVAADAEVRVVPWHDLGLIVRENELKFLSTISHFEATIPQDKIFSLHTVFRSMGLVLPAAAYEDTVVKVFCQTTMAYIQCRQKLGILSITLPPLESSGFPSWVPEWIIPQPLDMVDCDTTGVAYVNERRPGLYSEDSRAYCATLDSPPIILGTSDFEDHETTLRTLSLKGKLMGEVVSRFVCPVTGTDTVHRPDDFMHFTVTCMDWCGIVSMMEKETMRPEEVTHDTYPSEALFKLLTAHRRFRLFGIRPKLYEDYFRPWYQLMQYDGKGQLPEGLDIPEDAQGLSPQKTIHRIIWHGGDAKKYSIAERIFFFHEYIKEKANYALCLLDSLHLVLAYYTCREGDELALLPGSDHPMLLRRLQGSEFRIVAPALCHGMMYGECWTDDVDQDGYPFVSGLEDITLV